MSHPVNQDIAEFRRENSQGAFDREIQYPEGSVIDGIPLISETWLDKQEEAKEREDLRNWDESKIISEDIF